MVSTLALLEEALFGTNNSNEAGGINDRKGTAADKAVADKKRESRANLALVSIATTRSIMALFVVVSFLWTSHEVHSK